MVAPLIDAAMLYVINAWPGWEAAPFLTEDTPLVLGGRSVGRVVPGIDGFDVLPVGTAARDVALVAFPFDLALQIVDDVADFMARTGVVRSRHGAALLGSASHRPSGEYPAEGSVKPGR